MEVAFDPKFVPSMLALGLVDAQRVWKAVHQYVADPATPSLRLERMGGRAGSSRLWSIRVSDRLRVLLARQGPTSVFLRAGRHDAVYELANRSAFVVPVAGRPGLISLKHHALEVSEPSESDASAPPAASVGGREPSILEHWSTGELAEAGFDHAAIELLRRATADDLLDIWPDIDDEAFSRVVELSELSPEEWRQQQFPDDDAANERFHDAIVNQAALVRLPAEPRQVETFLKKTFLKLIRLHRGLWHFPSGVVMRVRDLARRRS